MMTTAADRRIQDSPSHAMRFAKPQRHTVTPAAAQEIPVEISSTPVKNNVDR
jgi:hypothetical protein